MKISIFGLGYVGAVSLACLARDGHEITGVDIDRDKLDLISNGKSPIVEEGIQELMKAVIRGDAVQVTDDAKKAIMNTELSFICVGTPSKSNGSQDLTAIKRLAQQMGEALRDKAEYHVVVVRSTVQPGTIDSTIRPILEEYSGKKSEEDFALCFQPEFLREGSSIRDYDNPPYTVVGCASERPVAILRSLFGSLPCDFVHTTVPTAEMLKYACNNFHALKCTFANEIGRVAQSVNVDSHEVMRLVCEDKQLNISSAYMRPGFAFGGSCLPKDLRALLYVAKSKDVEVPMLAGLLPSNNVHVEHAINIVLGQKKKKIGLIGLSFKSGTDDLRESPLVIMAERFIGKGQDLKIYDPEVSLSRLLGANRRYIEQSIPHLASLMDDSIENVIENSEVVIVGLQDDEIVSRLPDLIRPDQFVLDLVNVRSRDQLAGEYRGICW